MKKLLNILFLINIIFIPYINIIACLPQNNQKNLNTISVLQDLPGVPVEPTQRYISINHSWYNQTQIFKARPLLLTFTISYYQDNTGDVQIDYDLEQIGIVYIKITADPNDLYWKGATPLIAIKLGHGLSSITSLAGIPTIAANPQQKYHNIDPIVYNQAKEFNQHPLASNFTVHYFQDEAALISVDDQNQGIGNVYVKITAASNDHYWAGTTNSLQLVLISGGTQIDLNTINKLEGMSEIDIVANKKYSDIDKNIYNQSTTFKTKPLNISFTIHYFEDEAATKAVDSKEQAEGTIYVKITAANNDAYWIGTTKPLSITLKDNRADLNDISDLSGMDPIIVDPNLTYQEIDKNVINSSNQLKVAPLTGNFIIKYFSDKFAKHAINNYYQQIGIVYVIITPDYHTKTKWKANKTPIIFPIEKQK